MEMQRWGSPWEFWGQSIFCGSGSRFLMITGFDQNGCCIHPSVRFCSLL